MAFRRRRFFRRGRGKRPLLRWTAVNPPGFEYNLSAGGTPDEEGLFELVTPEVYQQNDFLEPDGATLTRCILDFWNVAIFNGDGSGNVQPFGLGLFLDAAVIVHDTNADLTNVLSVSNWADTMIRERVLWYGAKDYTFLWQPVAGASGTTNAAQAVGPQGPSNDLYEIPTTRVDFKVRARLQQNKAVSFIFRLSSTGYNGGESITGNLRMTARLLIAGRF